MKKHDILSEMQFLMDALYGGGQEQEAFWNDCADEVQAIGKIYTAKMYRENANFTHFYRVEVE